MGFGWLLLGYVISFLLSSVAGKLNIAFLANLIGYLLMLKGLSELRKYQKEFSLSFISVCALIPFAVWNGLDELGDLLLWNLPFLTDLSLSVVAWIRFAVVLFFQFTLYFAVAKLAKTVDLPNTVRQSVFNTVIAVGYSSLYVAISLPALASVQNQFGLALTIFRLFWIVCDICLLISCCKNICPEGEEDPKPKEYRLKFLNKMNESFENNFNRAANSTRNAKEESLRRKREKKRR